MAAIHRSAASKVKSEERRVKKQRSVSEGKANSNANNFTFNT